MEWTPIIFKRFYKTTEFYKNTGHGHFYEVYDEVSP
jgi:hypothetical protein